MFMIGNKVQKFNKGLSGCLQIFCLDKSLNVDFGEICESIQMYMILI